MIHHLVATIKNNPTIHYGKPVNSLYLQDCQEYLAEQKRGGLPSEFTFFLRYINGVFSDTAVLYGVTPENIAGMKDLVLQTELVFPHQKDMLLLGESTLEWFVYNQGKKIYQVYDRQEMQPVESFDSLEGMLDYCLQVM